jgi:hypothetical protein
MSQSKATRSIIDTHRHIFGPKLRQKFVENIGFDDSKPLPQANAGEMFFYRESVDVDYSMEIQRQSGVTLCVNSYGGEIETFSPGTLSPRGEGGVGSEPSQHLHHIRNCEVRGPVPGQPNRSALQGK